MSTHTAKSLFDLNMESSADLLKLYDGTRELGTQLEITWLLRAVVVFSVAALDSYFHDKVKYRAGKFDVQDMPPALARFEVPLRDLVKWDEARRKGNILRNWLTDYFSTKPLQKQDEIANALRMVGMNAVWATIEPNSPKRDALLQGMKDLIKRRNQIAHEGDRESSRRSGKTLRAIDRGYAEDAVSFVKSLVQRIEYAFPN